MKKFLLLLITIIIAFSCVACDEASLDDLTLEYDKANYICRITNTSDNDFTGLKTTVVLETSGGEYKKMEFDIGQLYKGETYIYDLSYIDEKIQDVYIKDYIYTRDFAIRIVIALFICIVVLIVIFMMYFIKALRKMFRYLKVSKTHRNN